MGLLEQRNISLQQGVFDFQRLSPQSTACPSVSVEPVHKETPK